MSLVITILAFYKEKLRHRSVCPFVQPPHHYFSCPLSIYVSGNVRMASLNRLKTYRNEYEFSDTITKIIFCQFVLILVNPYSIEYELTKMSTN